MILRKSKISFILATLVLAALFCALVFVGCESSSASNTIDDADKDAATKTVTDMVGRNAEIPSDVDADLKAAGYDFEKLDIAKL